MGGGGEETNEWEIDVKKQLVDQFQRKLEHIQEGFQSTDRGIVSPMVHVDYCDPDETIDKFLSFCRTGISTEAEQSKYLVAIVQATLSGKTRLLIEASLKDQPIVLISLQSKNLAFYKTLLPALAKYHVPVNNFYE